MQEMWRIKMLHTIREKNIIRLLIVGILALCLIITSFQHVDAATAYQATGKIKPKGGAYLRVSPSAKAKKIKVLKKNTKVTITEEVFESKNSAKAKKRWYKVKVSGKKGYVRSDCIKSIKYTSVTKQTTDSLNYRTGPGVKMAKKGTFKKGTKVSTVLKARVSGVKGVWYKVKLGKSYYYVHSAYVSKVKKTAAPKKTTTKKKTATKKAASTPIKTVKASTALNASSTAANKPVKTVYLEVKKEDVTVADTGIQVEGLRYPVLLAVNGAFSVMGTVTSPEELPIEKVKVGVVNSSGAWLISSEKDEINATTFDIYALDADIRFGSLAKGTYTYKVIITAGGKNYTAGKYKFKVIKLNGPSAIVNTAISLAWPEKTPVSTYKKSPTNAQRSAGKKCGVSAAADCGNFATIVLRNALGNNSIPNFLNAALNTKGSLKLMQAKAKPYGFTAFNWDGNINSLYPGDVLVYKKNGNTSSGRGQHIFIYLGNRKVAEASHTKHYYGYIDTKTPGKGVLSKSDRKFYYVLRCVLK